MQRWSTFSLFVSSLVLGVILWFGIKLRVQYDAQHSVPFTFAMAGIGLVFIVVLAKLIRRIVRRLIVLRIVRILLGVALLTIGVFLFIIHRDMQREGQKTQGVVVHRLDKTIHQFVDFIPVGDRHEYYLDFIYDVAGKSYSRTGVLVSKKTWDAAASDQKLSIEYLPSNPSESEIDVPNEQYWAGMVPYMALGIGAFLVFVGLRPSRGVTSTYQPRPSGHPRWREPKVIRR